MIFATEKFILSHRYFRTILEREEKLLEIIYFDLSRLVAYSRGWYPKKEKSFLKNISSCPFINFSCLSNLKKGQNVIIFRGSDDPLNREQYTFDQKFQVVFFIIIITLRTFSQIWLPFLWEITDGKFKNYHKIFKKFRKGLVSCIGILY